MMLSDSDAVDNHYHPSVRLLDIERNAQTNCGFHLTRVKWDPYPWVSSVDSGTAADLAGVQPGDCLLEVNGEDILGQKISEVAELVKSKSDQVSLLLWNAGVDLHCSPEAVCCGPMPTNLQRLSACMSTILAFLECPVCLDTIPPPTYQCENGHLICMRCRTKSERCPVCRLRYTRGRSLLADQVYNALIDAFNLREEPNEARSAKMQQIFKLKSKNHRNIPDIKITTTSSHTNKFLARLTGKSSSFDNLSSKKCASVTNLNSSTTNNGNCFDSNNLKAKSLSNQELFQQFESPIVSRSGSINRLNRNSTSATTPSIECKNLTINTNNNRPASYHGSFESISNRIDEWNCQNLVNNDMLACFCPFDTACDKKIGENRLLEHFQASHNDGGPLVHYFQSRISKLSLKKIAKVKQITYIVHFDKSLFFFKVETIENENILLWTWLMGNKNEAKEYDMQINVINKLNDNNVVLSVRNSICSLHSTPYSQIREQKKAVLLNTITFDKNNLANILLDVNIAKNDYS